MDSSSASIHRFYLEDDHEQKYERKWGYNNATAAAYWSQRNELIYTSLAQMGVHWNENSFGLEIGSGFGYELTKFNALGLRSNHLVGVDLMHHRVLRAKKLYTGVNFSQQNGFFSRLKITALMLFFRQLVCFTFPV